MRANLTLPLVEGEPDEERLVLRGDFPTPIRGQSPAIAQISHFGLRAIQICRPWRISRIENGVHSFGGKIFCMSNSISVGSVCFVNPSLYASRRTCVSTTNAGLWKTCPRITFAVLRPTPGIFNSSSIVDGTSPP